MVGFSHTNISSEQQFSWQKCLVDAKWEENGTNFHSSPKLDHRRYFLGTKLLEHHLHTSGYLWPCLWLYDHSQSSHLLMANFSSVMYQVTKLKLYKTCSLNEVIVLKWPPHWSDFSQTEHLWNVVEWKICNTDVQPTDLQQWRDVIV